MSLFRKVGSLKPIFTNFNQIRNLNLHEYQSKTLLGKHGVAVQDFFVVEKNSGNYDLNKVKGDHLVVKAQVLAGGRGMGTFDSGLQGGVQITKGKDSAKAIIKKMLGHKLVTKQTPKGGIECSKVMVSEFLDIIRETYVCIILDRQNEGPVLIASPKGGMNIEEVAQKTPEFMKYVLLDISGKFSLNDAEEVASFLGFSKNSISKAAKELIKLYEVFKTYDCTVLEINPFCEATNGDVICVDAKLNFDDNAKFRQKDVFQLQDDSETDVRELEAQKCDLNYIGLDGDIGCLVNGAGLAMATLDLIKLHGGNPANFLDVGGTVTEKEAIAAMKIITADPAVKCILVNIFGGIVSCTTIANGLISALKSIDVKLPVVCRLEGNNAAEARNMIDGSGLKIVAADTFDEAANKAVQFANQFQKEAQEKVNL